MADDRSPARVHHSRARLIVMFTAGLLATLVAGFLGIWPYAPILGWAIACLVYLAGVWFTIIPMDAERTARHSTTEDPSRASADLLLLIASIASLVAVIVVLADASTSSNSAKALIAALAVASVVLSWGLVHTLFTLRYASLYYNDEDGGVSFNQEAAPQYTDFAYLSFTLGMTFQVSDTNLTTPRFRATALRQALLAYLFGTVILATMINLVVGLG